ncbi:MAG: hypothetical protein ABI697_02260 [Devosia sp.]
MARKRKRRGFSEAQSPFAVADPRLLAAFDAYAFKCAFTGADLTAEAAADAGGELLRVDDDDFVPATIDAIYAYERGHLALGPTYNFIVDLAAISPELLEQLNPIGRLRLPAPPYPAPSQSAVRAHRTAAIEGQLKA